MKLDLTAGSVRERVGSQAHPARGTERCNTGRSRYPSHSWANARVSSLSAQLYSFCGMSITLPSRPDEFRRISTAPARQRICPRFGCGDRRSSTAIASYRGQWTASGGESVSQSPSKDNAFSTFLDQKPPSEFRPKVRFLHFVAPTALNSVRERAKGKLPSYRSA
jgi:hypothetical protein